MDSAGTPGRRVGLLPPATMQPSCRGSDLNRFSGRRTRIGPGKTDSDSRLGAEVMVRTRGNHIRPPWRDQHDS